MLRSSKGFTLVEVIVVMAIFIAVIVITGDAFKTILQQTTKVFRSEESNIEGIIGLEMMRHDLQQGGFGLFTENSPVAYAEAADDPADTYNEVSSTNPPRAFVGGNKLDPDDETSSGVTYTFLEDTDYLSIKGTSAAISRSAQKWNYLQYVAGTGGVPNSWPSADENFNDNERVVLLRRTITATANRLTIQPDAGKFYFPYSNTGFQQYSSSASFVMYGLSDASVTPRMPFNRTDYFVARPADDASVPNVCAPDIGILYKAIVDQASGNLVYYPILDCVADMQLVYGWDLMSGTSIGQDGLVDTWMTPDGTEYHCSGAACGITVPANYARNALSDAAMIRNGLKVVKVFILAQNGRLDPNYTSPATINLWELPDVPSSLGRTYSLTADMMHYRWKVYRMSVRPKNLAANQ